MQHAFPRSSVLIHTLFQNGLGVRGGTCSPDVSIVVLVLVVIFIIIVLVVVVALFILLLLIVIFLLVVLLLIVISLLIVVAIVIIICFVVICIHAQQLIKIDISRMHIGFGPHGIIEAIALIFIHKILVGMGQTKTMADFVAPVKKPRVLMRRGCG